jgi:hypothetical protein
VAGTFAGEARADHEVELIVFVIGTPTVQATLLPGFISTIYYGVATEKRMPVGWTVMNVITGVMGGTFGIMQFGIAVSETGGSSDKKQLRPLNIAAGGGAIIGSGVVITASILQTARPNTPPALAQTIRILPMISPAGAGPCAGLMAAGQF